MGTASLLWYRKANGVVAACNRPWQPVHGHLGLQEIPIFRC